MNNKFYKDIKLINNPNDINVLVNKNNKLDNNYIPHDLELIDKFFSSKNIYLRKVAKKNFENMCKEAKKNNLSIIAISGYRSYEYQKELYNNYVKEKGGIEADMCSARAGHSEHQTGLAIDISDNSLDYSNFGSSKEYIWIINNAYKYGFILRYPKDKEYLTGYKSEPWHIRYIGKNIAKYIFDNNITLEEYKKLSN